jgi:hypothetical protein
MDVDQNKFGGPIIITVLVYVKPMSAISAHDELHQGLFFYIFKISDSGNSL